MPTSASQQAVLLDTLEQPEFYPHPATTIERLETHISTVLLAGDYAYKFKKPVALDFLDFSTLALRQHYCEEELRLNQRLAPELYLAVVTITGSPQQPVFDGPGTPIDYAVKMRRFEQTDLLDHRLAQGHLQTAQIDAIADTIAAFHQALPAATTASAYGEPPAILATMQANFETLLPSQSEPDRHTQLVALQTWTEAEYSRLQPVLQERQATGLIRECHGDMHLANMAWIDAHVTIFDCIDFDPALRWIDVMSELAFVSMDLADRGTPAWAQRLVNRYVEQTGDYHGLQVLRFYQVYRALVRAKIATIRLQQTAATSAEHDALAAEYQSYVDLAETYTRPGPTALIITHGVSGSGKTTLTQSLLEQLGAIRLRADRERKRLAGLAANNRSGDGLNEGLYAPGMTANTYAHLAEQTAMLLQAGWPVIVDASFLDAAQRRRFQQLAKDHHVPFLILAFNAPAEQLRQRIQQRQAIDQDASDADLTVLAQQLNQFQALAVDEPALTVDTSQARIDAKAIAERLGLPTV